MSAILTRGFAVIRTALPTVCVVAALAAAFWWGHSTNWRAPRISAIVHDRDDDDDRPRKADPAPADASPRAWCEKHNLPEEQCVHCHPELAVKSAKSDELQPIAVQFDPAFRQAHDPKSCKYLHATVRLASDEAQLHSGIQVEPAREIPVAATVAANAVLEFQPNRIARIGPRLGGILWKSFKEHGDEVKAGELLALVEVPDVGKAKADFLQAVMQLESRNRARDALRVGVVPDRAVNEAEAAVREAKTQLFLSQQALANLGLPAPPLPPAGQPLEQTSRELRFLGLPGEALRAIPSNVMTANLSPLVAPFAGVVESRNAVDGEFVEPKQPVFVIVDPSRLHAHIDVPAQESALLRPGQRLTFVTDGDATAVGAGTVHWIAPAVDEKTRTVVVHGDLPNPDRKLRAKAFGTATIETRTSPTAVVVPASAVQWEGCSFIVFVRQQDPLTFRVRRIVPGRRTDRWVEIVSGIVPGEMVATTGSHALKSELLKDRLGSGDD